MRKEKAKAAESHHDHCVSSMDLIHFCKALSGKREGKKKEPKSRIRLLITRQSVCLSVNPYGPDLRRLILLADAQSVDPSNCVLHRPFATDTR